MSVCARGYTCLYVWGSRAWYLCMCVCTLVTMFVCTAEYSCVCVCGYNPLRSSPMFPISSSRRSHRPLECASLSVRVCLVPRALVCCRGACACSGACFRVSGACVGSSACCRSSCTRVSALRVCALVFVCFCVRASAMWLSRNEQVSR